MFNQQFLKSMATAREENEKSTGDPVIFDEEDAMNGKADMQITRFHIFIFWFILLALIEYKLPCICCSRFRKVNKKDNDKFVGRTKFEMENSDQGESSEAPEIFEEGEKLQIRFNAKQKF